jgi:hypothetical protein
MAKKISPEELEVILNNHAKWLKGYSDGIRADLSGYDLRNHDLRCKDLERADLSGAQLQGANLEHTLLRGANLRGANLRGADLRFTNLQDTNLLTFSFQGLTAFYNLEDSLTIGCETRTIDSWLLTYREVGLLHKLSKLEIELFGKFIHFCWQSKLIKQGICSEKPERSEETA